MKDVNVAKLWSVLRWIFLWVKTTFLKLYHVNHLNKPQERQCLSDLSYSSDLEIKPSFKDRLENIFLSDTKRRYKLLEWVQKILKTGKVTDFSSSWQDGIVLCTLIEHVSPGFCPRFDLLRPHHRVNNCRLGIKLVQKYLQLRKMSITPEEMAIADSHTESKIIQMIQMIKSKDNTTKPFDSCKAIVMGPNESMKSGLLGSVVARGTGLKTGVVGRKSKFHILTTPGSEVDIKIEICGPYNEKNSETIMSINPGISAEELQNESESRQARYISDKCGNVFLRQISLEDDNADIIPFYYQCVGESRFEVTYIPRSSGLHIITVKSAGRNVRGSPFKSKIRDFISSLNPLSKIKPVYFDKMQEPNLNRKYFKDILQCGRYSTFQEGKFQGDSKSLNVIRKRVVKRVMTKNGEEIVINESTPSPSMSRQSSVDISDCFEDEVVKRLPPSKIRKSSMGKLTLVSEKNTVGVKNSVENPDHTQGSSRPSSTDKDSEENRIQTGNFKPKNLDIPKGVECSTIAKNHILEDQHISCEGNLHVSLEGTESEKGDRTLDEDLSNLETSGTKSLISRSLSDGMLKNRYLRDVKRSNIGCKSSPKIKTLKSSSLRKACFYVSDKAFSQSFSCGSASENSSSDNLEEGANTEYQESNSQYSDNIHIAIDTEKTNEAEMVDEIRTGKNELIEVCINTKNKHARSMVDQSTQVKSDEIKLETGWRSQIRHLRRRQALNDDQGAIGSSIGKKDRGDDKLLTLQNLLINSKQYLYQDKNDSQSVTDAAIFHDRQVNGNNMLIHGAQQASRQSTIDTNDSGIDDSLRDIFFSYGHRRIAGRSYPCEISLDPRLTRNSASSISFDEKECESRLKNTYLDSKLSRFSGDSTVLNSPDAPLSVTQDNTEETSFSDSEISCVSGRSRRKVLIRARLRRHLTSSHEANRMEQKLPRSRCVDMLQIENFTDNQEKSDGTSEGEIHENDTTVKELTPRRQEQFALEPTPTHTLNELSLRYHTSCSSDDSYCGFGLSTSERKSFLGNIETFQNLTKNEIVCLNSGSDKTALYDESIESDQHNSPVGFHDEYEQSSEVFLDQFIDNNPHLLPEEERDHSLHSSNTVTDEVVGSGVQAFGPGLFHGIIDVKNHFQVYVERPDNGGLTVGVYGPLPHCVVETSINYTGSHIYEITYHVTLPGRYIISVKWAEKNITNSPFVCQVE